MKRLFLFSIWSITLFDTRSYGQQKLPVNWQLMDWQKDGYPGISLEEAYGKLLKNKTPLKKIVVAVIDCGMDSSHPDLAGIRWTNLGEIPGNGIDDDHNGFVDDIHGWNFGGNAVHETKEAVREYIRLRGKYENILDTAALDGDPEFDYWKQVLVDKKKIFGTVSLYASIIDDITAVRSYMGTQRGNGTMTIGDIRHMEPPARNNSLAIQFRALKDIFDRNRQIPDTSSIDSFANGLKYFLSVLNRDNLLVEARTAIENNDPAYFRKRELGDDPYTNKNSHYGNNNTFYTYPGMIHATNIDGIIGAIRNNGLGGNGISASVAIMTVIQQSDMLNHGQSDEWDKDIANGIRYAVDNGAQIINMSFGKYLSPQKEWVVDAMKYAERKGVLLIGGAGNDSSDNDLHPFYPFAYSNENILSNLIKVGASTYDSTLVAPFSNYGHSSVDVFAPGMAIYTTSPGGNYQWVDGTSFATPIVAGLAALIWSYYPEFDYRQVKYCIEHSAAPIRTSVRKPGTSERLPFSALSRMGGIVNAYKAIETAEGIRSGKVRYTR